MGGLRFPHFLTQTVSLRHQWYVKFYAWSWVLLFSGHLVNVRPSSTSRMVTSILRGQQSRCGPLWWVFCYIVWFGVVFFVFVRYSYSFFSYSFVWWSPLPIYPSSCKFLFNQAFWFFRDCSSIPSVIYPFLFLINGMAQFPLKIFISISSLSVFEFAVFFHIWQTVWCHSCTSGVCSFFAIHEVCIRLCIS